MSNYIQQNLNKGKELFMKAEIPPTNSNDLCLLAAHKNTYTKWQ